MKPGVRVRIEGDDATAAAFRSALGNAQATANRMSGLFKAAFAGISVSAISGIAMRAIEAGDELSKFATKAGIGGKAASELAHAAQMADVDIAGLSDSIRFMQKNLSEAATGSKIPQLALRALGIELESIRDLAADRQFELIADRISELKDPADKTRAATELFGRAGANLLPLFEEGAAGIRAARLEAERLGKSFTDEQIGKLSEADDAVKRLKASWEGFATALVSKVAPAITYVLDSAHGEASPQKQLDILRGEFSEAVIRGAPKEYLDTLERDIKRLELMRDRITRYDSGESSRGRYRGSPVGFAAADAEIRATEEARKAAEKAAAEQAKEMTRIRLEHAEYERREYLRIHESLQDDIEDVLQEGGRRAEEVLGFTLDNIAAEMEYSMRDVKDEMTVFAEQAARNMQTALADYFFSPFDDGLKGMLKGFIDVIRRMVAEVAAAKIFGSLGGAEGVGNFISGLIPGFASGGRPRVGMPAIVGERGPELFVPDTAGTIVPNHRLGGSVVVNISHNIDARGATQDVIRALPGVLAQNNAQVKADLVEWFNRRGYVR